MALDLVAWEQGMPPAIPPIKPEREGIFFRNSQYTPFLIVYS